MGIVVNKSFNKIRKDIYKRAIKLYHFVEDNHIELDGEWTDKQFKLFYKLQGLSESLVQEISLLDEIECPKPKKTK